MVSNRCAIQIRYWCVGFGADVSTENKSGASDAAQRKEPASALRKPVGWELRDFRLLLAFHSRDSIEQSSVGFIRFTLTLG